MVQEEEEWGSWARGEVDVGSGDPASKGGVETLSLGWEVEDLRRRMGGRVST